MILSSGELSFQPTTAGMREASNETTTHGRFGPELPPPSEEWATQTDSSSTFSPSSTMSLLNYHPNWPDNSAAVRPRDEGSVDHEELGAHPDVDRPQAARGRRRRQRFKGRPAGDRRRLIRSEDSHSIGEKANGLDRVQPAPKWSDGTIGLRFVRGGHSRMLANRDYFRGERPRGRTSRRSAEVRCNVDSLRTEVNNRSGARHHTEGHQSREIDCRRGGNQRPGVVRAGERAQCGPRRGLERRSRFAERRDVSAEASTAVHVRRQGGQGQSEARAHDDSSGARRAVRLDRRLNLKEEVPSSGFESWGFELLHDRSVDGPSWSKAGVDGCDDAAPDSKSSHHETRASHRACYLYEETPQTLNEAGDQRRSQTLASISRVAALSEIHLRSTYVSSLSSSRRCSIGSNWPRAGKSPPMQNTWSVSGEEADESAYDLSADDVVCEREEALSEKSYKEVDEECQAKSRSSSPPSIRHVTETPSTSAGETPGSGNSAGRNQDPEPGLPTNIAFAPASPNTDAHIPAARVPYCAFPGSAFQIPRRFSGVNNAGSGESGLSEHRTMDSYSAACSHWATADFPTPTVYDQPVPPIWCQAGVYEVCSPGVAGASISPSSGHAEIEPPGTDDFIAPLLAEFPRGYSPATYLPGTYVPASFAQALALQESPQGDGLTAYARAVYTQAGGPTTPDKRNRLFAFGPRNLYSTMRTEGVVLLPSSGELMLRGSPGEPNRWIPVISETPLHGHSENRATRKAFPIVQSQESGRYDDQATITLTTGSVRVHPGTVYTLPESKARSCTLKPGVVPQS